MGWERIFEARFVLKKNEKKLEKQNKNWLSKKKQTIWKPYPGILKCGPITHFPHSKERTKVKECLLKGKIWDNSDIWTQSLRRAWFNPKMSSTCAKTTKKIKFYGSNVGEAEEGCWLGTTVGTREGVSVGPTVGTFDGTRVGVTVGGWVGITVGTTVGSWVGVSVGTSVGSTLKDISTFIPYWKHFFSKLVQEIFWAKTNFDRI